MWQENPSKERGKRKNSEEFQHRFSPLEGSLWWKLLEKNKINRSYKKVRMFQTDMVDTARSRLSENSLFKIEKLIINKTAKLIGYPNTTKLIRNNERLGQNNWSFDEYVLEQFFMTCHSKASLLACYTKLSFTYFFAASVNFMVLEKQLEIFQPSCE